MSKSKPTSRKYSYDERKKIYLKKLAEGQPVNSKAIEREYGIPSSTVRSDMRVMREKSTESNTNNTPSYPAEIVTRTAPASTPTPTRHDWRANLDKMGRMMLTLIQEELDAGPEHRAEVRKWVQTYAGVARIQDSMLSQGSASAVDDPDFAMFIRGLKSAADEIERKCRDRLNETYGKDFSVWDYMLKRASNSKTGITAKVIE